MDNKQIGFAERKHETYFSKLNFGLIFISLLILFFVFLSVLKRKGEKKQGYNLEKEFL